MITAKSDSGVHRARPDRSDGHQLEFEPILISVGSGGLTGKGWTQGTQAKLRYLPRPH